MNRFTLAGAALGAGLLFSGGAIGDDEAAITQPAHDGVAAISACKPDDLAKVWSKKGTIFPPAGTSPLTAEQEVASWKDSCAKGEKVQMKTKVLSVSQFGDVAIITGNNSGTFTPPNGEARPFTNRLTVVMTKEDGKWKVFHVHTSAPLPPPAE